jgi:hypothetical protein
MAGKELGRLRAAHIFHALPETNAFTRIVTSPPHVKEADGVGFGFMFAAEWHEDTKLRAGAERPHHCALFVVIHVRERHRHTG